MVATSPVESSTKSSTVDRRPGTAGRDWLILFTLAAIQFIGLVDFMIVMPLGPQLLADLGIDARAFSWVVSACLRS